MVGILTLTFLGLGFLAGAGHLAYRYRKEAKKPLPFERGERAIAKRIRRQNVVEVIVMVVIGVIILAIALIIAVFAG